MNLDKIKGRCRIDDFTGCWVWAGALSPSNGGKTKQPRIYAQDYTRDPTGNTKTVQTGNRAAWHVSTGQPIPPGHRVYKAACCTNGLCVNHDHLACGTSAAWGQVVTAKQIWKGQRTRIAANQAIGRARSVVTPDLAREIQGSNESGLHIAARLGIPRSVVSRVRLGKLVSVQSMNNPFSRLMA